MPQVPFTPSTYDFQDYGVPPAILENFYPERLEERSDWPFRLVMTPGLVQTGEGVEGKIARGVTQADELVNGEIVSIAGDEVSRYDADGNRTLIGTVADDGKPVTFASSQAQMIVVSGGRAYIITADAVEDITANFTINSGPIIDVAVFNNRHLYVEGGSGRIIFSRPGDGSDIQGEFFTAEQSPDQLRGVMVVSASIFAIGTRTIELFTGTTSDNVPFIRRNGNILRVGMMATRANAELDGIGYWVGEDSVVYLWAGGRQRPISPAWMERELSKLQPDERLLVRMNVHSWSGHKFISIAIPGIGDFFFDQATEQWHRRKATSITPGAQWDYDYFVQAFGDTFVQRKVDGAIFRFSPFVYRENQISVRRVATALVPVRKATAITNVVIECQAGIGRPEPGNAIRTDPKIEIAIAHDGITYGPGQIRELGRMGQTFVRPSVLQMGTVRPPLCAIQVAFSDSAPLTLLGLTYGERIN